MFDSDNPFSDDYELPTSETGEYLNKLKVGETKIRILSEPISGWQDWTLEQKPIRFRNSQKPDKPINPKNKVKPFWSMIIWNYNEKKIQIYTTDKATIQKKIKAFSQNPDWGKPQLYDLTLIRKGADKNTDYDVIQSPKKPVDAEIIQAFHDKKICLSALYGGGDPFAPGQPADKLADCLLPGNMAANFITPAQYKEIMDYIGNDMEYLTKLTHNCKMHFNAPTLKELPPGKYDAVLKSVKMWAKEKAEKEMSNKLDDELPF